MSGEVSVVEEDEDKMRMFTSKQSLISSQLIYHIVAACDKPKGSSVGEMKGEGRKTEVKVHRIVSPHS